MDVLSDDPAVTIVNRPSGGGHGDRAQTVLLRAEEELAAPDHLKPEEGREEQQQGAQQKQVRRRRPLPSPPGLIRFRRSAPVLVYRLRSHTGVRGPTGLLRRYA